MISYVLLTLYVFYGMVKIPIFEYVSSLALGVMAFVLTKSVELSVLTVLIANFLLPMVRTREGFADSGEAEAEAEPEPPAEPSAEAEGQVTGTASPSVDTSSEAESTSLTAPTGTFAGSSTPASKVTNAPVKKLNEKTPPANEPADLLKKEEFEDSSGLFKVGKLPSEEKGGFHIDTGTSVLNALKALKPDQISAMTQDTKQLIETQKTLMNMLQSFKPMMSEGKDMMDTFQQMFASNGSASSALQTAQDRLKG
jgi:hypothetical protein